MRQFIAFATVCSALAASVACCDINLSVPDVNVHGLDEIGGGEDPLRDPQVSASAVLTECFKAAQQTYPDLNASVTVGGETFGPYSEIAAIFEAVAFASSPDELGLAAGSYSTDAIKWTMDCILDGGHLTWSVALLNQSDGTYAVRPSGGWLVSTPSGNQVLNTISLEEIKNGKAIVFRELTGVNSCLAVAVAAEPVSGSSDFVVTLSNDGGGAVVPGQTCRGVNCRECGFQTDGHGCTSCLETGDGEDSPDCLHTITSGSFESPSYLGAFAF